MTHSTKQKCIFNQNQFCYPSVAADWKSRVVSTNCTFSSSYGEQDTVRRWRMKHNKSSNKVSEKLLLVPMDVWVKNSDSTSWKPCELSHVFVNNQTSIRNLNTIKFLVFGISFIAAKYFSCNYLTCGNRSLMNEKSRWFGQQPDKASSTEDLSLRWAEHFSLKSFQKRWSIQVGTSSFARWLHKL